MVAKLSDAGSGKTSGVISLIGIHTTASANFYGTGLGDKTAGQPDQHVNSTTAPIYFGYERVKDSADEYNRIHWNAANQTTPNAPDPLDPNTGLTPYSLKDWEGYYTYDGNKERPTSIDVLDRDVDGFGNATIQLNIQTKPPGFDDYNNNADTASDITFRVRIKTCTDLSPGNECDGDAAPTDGNSYQTKEDDGPAITVNNLVELTWYIGSVVTKWDYTGNDNYSESNVGVWLTSGYTDQTDGNIRGRDGGNYIVFKTKEYTDGTCNSAGIIGVGASCTEAETSYGGGSPTRANPGYRNYTGTVPQPGKQLFMTTPCSTTNMVQYQYVCVEDTGGGGGNVWCWSHTGGELGSNRISECSI